MGRAFDVSRDLDLSYAFGTNFEEHGGDPFQTSSHSPYGKLSRYCSPWSIQTVVTGLVMLMVMTVAQIFTMAMATATPMPNIVARIARSLIRMRARMEIYLGNL